MSKKSCPISFSNFGSNLGQIPVNDSYLPWDLDSYADISAIELKESPMYVQEVLTHFI